MTTLNALPVYVGTWLGQLGWGASYVSTIGGHFGRGAPFNTSSLAGASDYTPPPYTPISVHLVDHWSTVGPGEAWQPTITIDSLSGGTGSYSYTWVVGAIDYGGGSGGFSVVSGQNSPAFTFYAYMNGAGSTMTIPIYVYINDGVTDVNSNTIYIQFTGEFDPGGGS